MVLRADQIMMYGGPYPDDYFTTRLKGINDILGDNPVQGGWMTTTVDMPSAIYNQVKNTWAVGGEFQRGRAAWPNEFKKAVYAVPLNFNLDNVTTGKTTGGVLNTTLAKEGFEAVRDDGWYYGHLVNGTRVAPWKGNPPATGGVLTYFKNMAQEMKDQSDVTHYVRLGWEFNGRWFAWGTNENVTVWKEAFKAAVGAIRSVNATNIKIDWNFSLGPSHNDMTTLWNSYPGDDYVDVIGIDAYQRPSLSGWWTIDSDTTWNNWFGNDLKAVRDFAVLHSKPISFPEWASGGPGQGLEWLRRMTLFMDNLPSTGGGRLEYHCWFSPPKSKEKDTAGMWVEGFHDIITPDRDTIAVERRLIQTRALYGQIFSTLTVPTVPYQNSDPVWVAGGGTTVTLTYADSPSTAGTVTTSGGTSSSLIVSLVQATETNSTDALTVQQTQASIAPTVVGAGTVVSSASLAVTPPLPSGVTANDLLLLVISGRPWNTGNDPDIEGWVPVASNYVEVGNIDLQQLVLTRTASTGETAPTVTLPPTWSGTARGLSAFIVAVRGANPTLDAVSPTSAVSATTVQHSTVVAPQNALLVDIVAVPAARTLSLQTANLFTANVTSQATVGGTHSAGMAYRAATVAGTYTLPVWTETGTATVWAGATLTITSVGTYAETLGEAPETDSTDVLTVDLALAVDLVAFDELDTAEPLLYEGASELVAATSTETAGTLDVELFRAMDTATEFCDAGAVTVSRRSLPEGRLSLAVLPVNRSRIGTGAMQLLVAGTNGGSVKVSHVDIVATFTNSQSAGVVDFFIADPDGSCRLLHSVPALSTRIQLDLELSPDQQLLAARTSIDPTVEVAAYGRDMISLTNTTLRSRPPYATGALATVLRRKGTTFGVGIESASSYSALNDTEYVADLANSHDLVSTDHSGSTEPAAMWTDGTLADGITAWDFTATDRWSAWCDLYYRRSEFRHLFSSWPTWLTTPTSEQVDALLDQVIDTMTARYPNVDIWSVVGNPIADTETGRTHNLKASPFSAYGEAHTSWIDSVFIRAKAAKPNAVLALTETGALWGQKGVETASTKTQRLISLVAGMLNRGVPIDRVNLSCRFALAALGSEWVPADERLRWVFDQLQQLGVEVALVDIDLPVSGNGPPTAPQAAEQAATFQRLVQTAISAGAVALSTRYSRDIDATGSSHSAADFTRKAGWVSTVAALNN